MSHPYDGIYAIASLDGAPVAPRDAAALGIPLSDEGQEIVLATSDRGTVAAGANRVFVGHLDEPVAVAAMLGLATATTAADLVAAALDRDGDDAPMRLLGEWAFADWDPARCALTLAVSGTLRDPLLFATDGRRVAVAPHPRPLRRVGWIDAAFGPAMLLTMGRPALRELIGDRTMLRGVRCVEAGTRLTIDASGVRAGGRAALPAPERWRGSFADAMTEVEALLRRIVREQMQRAGDAAIMLSGGLDSSLLAVFAAAERPSATSLVAVTSAAPPGSGLLDEVEFARAVADQAGIAFLPVVPADDSDVYRPSSDTLHWLDQPVCSARHYLYDALYRTAAEQGAHATFDGCDGEMTLTGYPDETGWRPWLRETLARVRRGPVARRGDAVAQQAFHAQLTPDAIALVADEAREGFRAPPFADAVHGRDDVWGYSTAIAKKWRQTTTIQRPGMRHLLPFRDRRLLTLFAGMPYAFMTHGGITRAPARALLAGRVPEHVRLRTRGRPFSPDYRQRIRAQAGPARAHLAGYRRAGVGDWIDLAWLDSSLARIAAGGDITEEMVTRTQITACTAAFLGHWLSDE